MTPQELAVVNDSQGDWQIRVVPNKYPAVSVATERHAQGLQSLGVCGERFAPHGAHEVIVESPRHVLDWTELSTDELANVLRMFRDRLGNAFAEHRLTAGLIFKNVGQAAGASLEHVHSQLIALPFVPHVLELEVVIANVFHQQRSECLMCHLLADEIRQGTRMIVQNSHFAAICAYAARQPYETWIIPKAHASHYAELSDAESEALAAIFRQTLRLLGTVLTPLAYNAVLHTAPAGDERSAAFHWHWEVIPRSASLAGFEWGTGMYINSVSPERAAIRLRSSNSGENLPIQ
jgi:UDPglucose--hexose-1-phosphate uridylyltransferase